MSAAVVDSAGVNHPVTLRNLFRVYSDPTSSYAIRSVKDQGWSSPQPDEIYSAPYMGQWMAVVDLVDPTTGQPPALATGAAQLVLTDSNPSDSNSPYTSDLTILPGTGAINPMRVNGLSGYVPLNTLEPMPQVAVTLSGTPSTPLGGGTFTFSYDTAAFGGANTAPTVVMTSSDRNIELSSTQVAQSNGTTLMTVSILNPHGFEVGNNSGTNLMAQMSLQRDLQFLIVWDKSLTNITDANWQTYLQLVSGHYFDLNGATVSGLTPALTKIR
ncbi:MAG: hypothetical protein ACYDBH_05115 [Acidobacteriaceae bacterium]